MKKVAGLSTGAYRLLLTDNSRFFGLLIHDELARTLLCLKSTKQRGIAAEHKQTRHPYLNQIAMQKHNAQQLPIYAPTGCHPETRELECARRGQSHDRASEPDKSRAR